MPVHPGVVAALRIRSTHRRRTSCRATGARGLRAILEEVLLNTMYDLPGRTDIGKVVIDENTVREKVNPTLVPREQGRSNRPRRAAS